MSFATQSIVAGRGGSLPVGSVCAFLFIVDDGRENVVVKVLVL
jgi:hypothetical protein